MKHICIIHPKGIQPFQFEKSDTVISTWPYDKESIALSKKDEDISWHEEIKKNLIKDKIEKIDTIIIDRDCPIKDAVKIACHIRLTKEWPSLVEVPIIWINESPLEELLREFKLAQIIPFGSVNYISTFGINTNLDLNEEIYVKLEELDTPLITKPIINFSQFLINPPSSSTDHQITNEWGAYKLAHTAGLGTLAALIEEQQERSKSLYFKYLKCKNNLTASPLGMAPTQKHFDKRFLYIDDNYAKGWLLVHQAILQQVDPNLGVDPFKNIDKIAIEESTILNEIIDFIKRENYQGVLLDLRLTQLDEIPEKNNTQIEEFTGGRILKRIKKEFPYLPVIMVTASSKAWNMRQLINEGADGYFIKEDPSSKPSPEISKANYEAFVELIKASQKKYSRLAPFWPLIEQIKKDGTLVGERLIDGKSTKVEERIIERLEMFFGLLKRGGEDTNYNQQFHYSDLKLAFMTLWSCLNEIQYDYLEKQKIGDSRNHIIEIRNHFLAKKGIPQNLKYLTWQVGNGLKTRIYEDWDARTFKLLQNATNSKDRSQSIGHQIATLIIGFLHDQSNLREELLKNIFELKDRRNRLYLAHGDEKPGNDFFFQLEEENENLNLIDCCQLFEIVYFLLMGNHVRIDTSKF